MNYDPIAGLQITGFNPLRMFGVPHSRSDAAYPMLCRQAQRIAFRCAKSQDRLSSGPEEAIGERSIKLTMDHGGKRNADEIAYRARTLSGHNPRIRRDAWIRRLDLLAIR